ncbi:MAG: histidinol-phosphate transaminase [Terriglobales bacterium]
MGRFFDLITEPVRAAGQYTTGQSSSSTPAQGDASLVKLNANESAYGPSPKAVAAMRMALESSHLYPDDGASALRGRLAEHHGVNPEQIVVSNGTTALLGVIARTLLRPGLNAVTSACSFISYPMVTHAAGAQLVEAPLRENGYDLDAILAAIHADTRIVFLANPNNPTGTVAEEGVVDRFLERVPAHVVVVLDEAYFDYAHYFAAQRGLKYSRAADYVREDQNVVVLRTFSKAHGLAGIRVGYGMGPAELLAYFARVQDVFAVSAVAQAAARAALDDEAHVRAAAEQNGQQAAWLEREVAALGYSVDCTWANFLSFDVRQDARALARRLRREGVLVRPLGSWGAPTWIRVTLGNAEQNQVFVGALTKMSK